MLFSFHFVWIRLIIRYSVLAKLIVFWPYWLLSHYEEKWTLWGERAWKMDTLSKKKISKISSLSRILVIFMPNSKSSRTYSICNQWPWIIAQSIKQLLLLLLVHFFLTDHCVDGRLRRNKILTKLVITYKSDMSDTCMILF